jgi:hypothetical protein
MTAEPMRTDAVDPSGSGLSSGRDPGLVRRGYIIIFPRRSRGCSAERWRRLAHVP